MKPLITFLLIALAAASCKPEVNTKNNMIPLDKIEEIFNYLESNGVNTGDEMLYGYFFTNETPEPLEQLAEELKKENYRFVDIVQDENSLLWLHMEKIEIHNPTSLFTLNEKLYTFAKKYQLNSYDGFDIGNKDPRKPFDRDTYVVTKNGIKNYYTFRDTYKGIRNFYLVTNDKDGASNFLKLLQKSGVQRKFDFEVLTDKEWTLYHSIMAKLQDSN